MNDVFCTSNAVDISRMRESFDRSSKRNIVDSLKSELGGEHEKLILFLLLEGRSEAPAESDKV